MENVQKKLDAWLESLGDRKPALLLHACCAPCSSWPLEYLSERLAVTLFFYNPNMDTEAEYFKRAEELKRLIREMNLDGKVNVVIAPYEHEDFEEMARGLEEEPERGKRCLKCYELRLRKTAEYMRNHPEFARFATTLTLSPLKNAEAINGIGLKLADRLEVPYLETDFKKKNGYLRSLALSKQYDLYRQNYCGCRFSKKGKA